MPRFLYEAIDALGLPQADTLVAVDLVAANRALKARGYKILSLIPIPEVSAPPELSALTAREAPADGVGLGDLQHRLEQMRGRLARRLQEPRPGAAQVDELLDQVLADEPLAHLGPRDLELFTGHLGVLLKAGVPILSALQTLAQEGKGKQMAAGLAASLGQGNRLSTALRRYPVFDPIFLRLVYLGEETGRLVGVLERLSEMLKQRGQMRSRLLQALIYPMTLLGMSLATLAFLLLYMVPQFMATFGDGGLTLPPLTRGLYAASRHPLMSYAALLAALSPLALAAFFRHPRGREVWRWGLFNLPMLGRLNSARAMAQACTSLGMLVDLGVPLTQVLTLLVGTTGSARLDQALTDVLLRVQDGENLAEAMDANPVFPKIVVSTVAAGLPAGRLDYLLPRVADLMNMQVETETEQLLTMVEPVLLGVFGMLVALVVLAVFMPVYQLAAIPL